MTKSRLSSSSSLSPEEIWSAAFADVCQQISPCFGRSETRQHAQGYLRGLLSSVKRKNGWQLAEEAGERTPYAMQYLLDRACWESDDLRDLCWLLGRSVRENAISELFDSHSFLGNVLVF